MNNYFRQGFEKQAILGTVAKGAAGVAKGAAGVAGKGLAGLAGKVGGALTGGGLLTKAFALSEAKNVVDQTSNAVKKSRSMGLQI